MSESLITLWINSENNTLLPSWNSFGTTTIPQLKQGDSVKFEIHWVRTDLGGQFIEEVEIPSLATIRMAVGLPNGGPSGGSFVYSYDGDSVEIPYDATAEDASTLINGLASITAAGGVSVSIVNQRTFRIVFNEFGVRELSTCDSTLLTPSTNVLVTRINTGSPTLKEVQHLRPKLTPVAFSDDFIETDLPQISISAIDSITKRISISPSPKFGSFTISNGTLTTSALSVTSSASDIQNALIQSEISNDERNYSVVKSGYYSWDIYRTSGTSETLTVSNSGMVGFSSRVGVIDLNTVELEDLLAGQPSATAVLEVEYSNGDIKQTLYQANVTIVNDLIDNASYSPIPFPSFIEEAPSDGNLYARKDGAWTAFIEEDNLGITQEYADEHYYPLNSNPANYLDNDDTIDGGTY